MSPTPQTRTAVETLHAVLDPRTPSLADLAFAHHLIRGDEANGLTAFYFWASGVSPTGEDAEARLQAFLNGEHLDPQRSEHVQQACRLLGDYAADHTLDGGDPDQAWRLAAEYLLMAAVIARGSIQVLSQITYAHTTAPEHAAASALLPCALRRLALASTAGEVGA